MRTAAEAFGQAFMKRQLDPKGALIGFGMFVVLWQILSVVINRPIMPTPIKVLPLFVREMPGDLGVQVPRGYCPPSRYP